MSMALGKELQAADTVSDPRWASVVARDASADSEFVYSVRTTGVYCRPSCPARLARPENVRFQRARTIVRKALTDDGVAGTIDDLVANLLDAA